MKRKSEKARAWNWCSKYIRLRDAVACHKAHPGRPFGGVACCTCGRVVVWDKNCDAGHFISRGMGGSSGVYFDERNIHAQCKLCNGFEGGRPHEYEQFMLDKYGQETIDELRFLHKNRLITHRDVSGYELYYKEAYKELKKNISE